MAIRGNIKLFCLVLKEKKLAAQKTVIRLRPNTPNIDKLANEGVHFTQAVCQAPMCVPSRNSMMLGLYPNQIGILRNEPGLPDDKLPNLTLPQALKNAGYETAGFGKTHWGINSSTRGFETRYIGQMREKGAKMMVDLDPEAKKEYDNETLQYGAGEEGNYGYIGETSRVKEENHRDGWVFNRCLEFIKARKDQRPSNSNARAPIIPVRIKSLKGTMFR